MSTQDKKDFDQRVGQLVKRFREARGLSQKALATAANKLGAQFTQDSIAKTESGIRTLKYEDAVRLCQTLNIRLEQLQPPTSTAGEMLESAQVAFDEVLAKSNAVEQAVEDFLDAVTHAMAEEHRFYFSVIEEGALSKLHLGAGETDNSVLVEVADRLENMWKPMNHSRVRIVESQAKLRKVHAEINVHQSITEIDRALLIQNPPAAIEAVLDGREYARKIEIEKKRNTQKQCPSREGHTGGCC